MASDEPRWLECHLLLTFAGRIPVIATGYFASKKAQKKLSHEEVRIGTKIWEA